jgi:hypothetical protein
MSKTDDKQNEAERRKSSKKVNFKYVFRHENIELFEKLFTKK